MAKPKSTLHQQMLTTAANLDAQYSELIELRQRVQEALLTRYPDPKTEDGLPRCSARRANTNTPASGFAHIDNRARSRATPTRWRD